MKIVPQSDARAIMKLVYIAGPFTADTAWEIEQNIRRAEEVALQVAEVGAVPVCPHTMYRFFHGTISPTFWYAATMALLKKCDAIVMLEGYQKSKGAVMEYQWACDDRLPIFHAPSCMSTPRWGLFKEWLEE